MSDSDDVNQNEIEELLRQAQEAAAGGTSESPSAESAAEKPAEPASPPAADDDAAIDQNDIEGLLAQADAGQPAASAQATAPQETAAEAPAQAAASAQGASPAGDSTQDDINLLLDQAQEALDSVDRPTAADLEGIAPFKFQDFAGAPPSTEKATLELLRDVELDLKIELGRTHMQLEDILKLRKGSVVPLNKLAGDPVDIYVILVNGRLIARGEVLVLNDNFCVRVAQLLAGEEAA